MENKIKLSMMQLNPYEVDNIVSSEEKEIKGFEYVTWGDRNKYPQYLYHLYSNSPTLKSIISTTVKYILGNEVITTIEKVNDDDFIEDIIEALAKDLVLYGGFALNVLRNRMGNIAQVHYLDFKNIRTDKKNEIFYYSEDWDNKTYGRIKSIKYPKFKKDSKDASSIYYYKNSRITTYPVPEWSSASLSVETECRINEYNLNTIINGFSGSYIISLNNGTPSDEVKEEIERGFNDKFVGNENAGRLVISYSDDKEHAPEILAVPEDKSIEKYQETVKRAREQIFCAFRITPNLCGVMTENLGFNSEEYKSAFLLFNKTVIQPLQKVIVRCLTDLFEQEIKIEPFSINFEDASENNNEAIEE